MSEIDFGDVFLFAVAVTGLCIFWFFMIVPAVDHQNFVNQAPKITKEITVTNLQVGGGLLIGYYLITDSNGDEYLSYSPTGFELSTGSGDIHIHVGHTHNITYYCNENNNRVIINAVDISPNPVDRLKCVNVSGRCE